MCAGRRGLAGHGGEPVKLTAHMWIRHTHSLGLWECCAIQPSCLFPPFSPEDFHVSILELPLHCKVLDEGDCGSYSCGFLLLCLVQNDQNFNSLERRGTQGPGPLAKLWSSSRVLSTLPRHLTLQDFSYAEFLQDSMSNRFSSLNAYISDTARWTHTHTHMCTCTSSVLGRIV